MRTFLRVFEIFRATAAIVCFIGMIVTAATPGFSHVARPDVAVEGLAANTKFRLWGRGPEVEKLRAALVWWGALDPSKSRGERYDLEVMKAVRDFQKRAGVRVTGIPRAETLIALAKTADTRQAAPATPPAPIASPAAPESSTKAASPQTSDQKAPIAPTPAGRPEAAPPRAPTAALAPASPKASEVPTPSRSPVKPADAPVPQQPVPAASTNASAPNAPAPKAPEKTPQSPAPSASIVLQAPAPSIASSGLPMLHSRSAAMLAEAAKTYQSTVASGGWTVLTSRAQFELGKPHDLVEPLRRRLAAEAYLGKDAVQGNVFDRTLSDALRYFQRRHGLTQRDEIDRPTLAALNVSAELRLRQIEESRARAMMPLFAKLDLTNNPYVVLNIPAMMTELVDKGKVDSTYVTIVGKPKTPSPQLVARITSVSPTPAWTVPYSIAINEISSRARRNPLYLERQDMRVERNGVPVNPITLKWSVRNYELRQKPGPRNSLGLLRIDMRNPHSVYLHDTPNRSLFDRRNRYRSHGCARVRDVFSLAAALLRYSEPGWTRDALMKRIKDHDGGWEAGQKIPLKASVLVVWIYLTAWVAEDGKVEFRNDRYGRDRLAARR
jgi:murein L,D-transpeptidase YcbB/YkuD